MNLVRLDSLFHVKYGTNLELNALALDNKGINFVSRTSKNNGVSAKVKLIQGLQPIEAGALTVAGGGSVLETFLQFEPFYSGRDLYYLTPIVKMTEAQKLFYAKCISANKYKYSYGRQANKTLKELLIPDLDSLPSWVNQTTIELPDGTKSAKSPNKAFELDTSSWQEFSYKELFEISRGRGPRKKDIGNSGTTPFITSIETNNGLTDYCEHPAVHPANTLTVNRNGSVAEAFYQPFPFCSTEDVHVFNPKFEMNVYIGLFLITLIKKEKYRYSYGRKWGIDRMNNSIIKLPVKKDGAPDFGYMENYIKSLPYSSQI